MPEYIQPENNRDFTTGPEDWTGDFTWHGDILRGRQGYISVAFPLSPDPSSFELNYPALKPPPSRLVVVGFKLTYVGTVEYPPTQNAILTDGVYEFDLPYLSGNSSVEWASYGATIDLPADWNKENAKIEIELIDGVGMVGDLSYDDFSIFYTPTAKPQYLPIMGVG